MDIVAVRTCSKHLPHVAAMLRAVADGELRQLDQRTLAMAKAQA